MRMSNGEGIKQWSDALTRIELRVRHDNARAISLYEEIGFRLEGTLRGAFIVDGVEHDDQIMGLRLHREQPSIRG